MYKVLLDSDKYFLSYSTLINPLEPDVHHMMSQILPILIDFLPRSLYHFFDHFSNLQTFITLERERYQETVNGNVPDFSRTFR